MIIDWCNWSQTWNPLDVEDSSEQELKEEEPHEECDSEYGKQCVTNTVPRKLEAAKVGTLQEKAATAKWNIDEPCTWPCAESQRKCWEYTLNFGSNTWSKLLMTLSPPVEVSCFNQEPVRKFIAFV